MSEGMRWWIEDNDANRYVPPDYVKPRYIEVMPVAEHDRVVQKQAKVIEVLKACILKEEARCGIWYWGRKAIERAETIERGEA